MFRATRIERDVHTECLHEPLKESCPGFLRSLGHCSYLGQIGRASPSTPETCKEDLAIDTELLILRLLPPPPPPPPPPFAIASNGRLVQGLGGAPPAAAPPRTPINSHIAATAAAAEREKGAGRHLGSGRCARPGGVPEICTAGRCRRRPPSRGEGDGARGQIPSQARATRSLRVAPAPSSASEGAW